MSTHNSIEPSAMRSQKQSLQAHCSFSKPSSSTSFSSPSSLSSVFSTLALVSPPNAATDRSKSISVSPFLVYLLLFVTALAPVAGYPFRDVSLAAGLRRPFGRRKKYGNACVADLDGDGCPDLLLGHHGDRSMQVYFNQCNGTFVPSDFFFWRDIHGLSPVRLSPYHSTMHFMVSRGGAYGLDPAPVYVFRVSSDRRITEVTSTSGELQQQRSLGRGRSILFLNLDRQWFSKPFPDMLSLNAHDGSGRHHKAFALQNHGQFKFQGLQKSSKFRAHPGTHAIVTSVTGGPALDVVLFYKLSVWELTGDYKLSDVSARVLPADYGVKYFTVGSAAEFDFDNDGRWDLFLTQAAVSDLKWVRRRPVRDALLRNVGRRYVDVGRTAGVPGAAAGVRASQSRGVTTADFDNDGWEDVFVVRYVGNPAVQLLRNRGDGTFEQVSSHGISRASFISGDSATAVDYDLDGRVDLIVSEGDWFNSKRGGFYKIFRNIGRRNGNGFLLVRVRNAPRRTVTSLHAVVYVETYPQGSNGRVHRMMRRVGSPGVTVSQSYVETVHFGVGKATVVAKVRCVWTDGSSLTRRNVAVNSRISVGWP